MSVMMEYKCPFCGGAMEFDSTIQKMKCPYCDSEMTVEEFQRQQKKSEIVQDSTAEKIGWQERPTECACMPVSPAAVKSSRRKQPERRAVRSAAIVS